MIEAELKQQYRDEVNDSLTRINRVAAIFVILVTGVLVLSGDPANFSREVSLKTFGYEVLPHMLVARLIGLIGGAAALLIAWVPQLRRFAFYGAICLYISTVGQCIHLTAAMSNFDASVTAWIMVAVAMLAVYPLPLSWSIAFAALGYVYYLAIFFGVYQGAAQLAKVNDPLGAPHLRFMMAMINTVAITSFSLAFKVALQRIRKKEFTFRKGLEKANVEIVRLNDKLRDENVKLSHELEVARHIQEVVLPAKAEYTAFPELDVACKMVPATEVGGDYYDTIQLSPNGIFSIGDVTDHGLHSGLIMMMVHTVIRSLSQVEGSTLTSIYNVVNKIVYEFRVKTGDYRFISLLILQYLGNGGFRMTGQHESVLIMRRDGRIDELSTMELGMYAGLDKDISHLLQLQEFKLESGDTLILYTDGITEAMNPKQVEFGKEGIIKSALAVKDQSAEAIKENVVTQCFAHLDGAPIHDDLSLLVIKKR